MASWNDSITSYYNNRFEDDNTAEDTDDSNRERQQEARRSHPSIAEALSLDVFPGATKQARQYIKELHATGELDTESGQARRAEEQAAAIGRGETVGGIDYKRVFGTGANLPELYGQKGAVIAKKFLKKETQKKLRNVLFEADPRDPSEKGLKVSGLQLMLSQNIKNDLIKQWEIHNPQQELPKNVLKTFTDASRGMAIKIQEDPAWLASKAEFMQGVKAVSYDLLIAGGAAVWNTGSIFQYMFDKVQDIFDKEGTDPDDFKYSKTGRQLVKSLADTFNSIHNETDDWKLFGMKVFPETNVAYKQRILRDEYGINADASTTEVILGLGRGTATSGARIGQFLAGGVGPNVGISLAVKGGAKAATKKFKAYAKDNAPFYSGPMPKNVDPVRIPLDKLSPGQFVKLESDYIRASRKFGFRLTNETGLKHLSLFVTRDIPGLITKPFHPALVRSGLKTGRLLQGAKEAGVAAKAGPYGSITGLNIRNRVKQITDKDREITKTYKEINDAFVTGNKNKVQALSEKVGVLEAEKFGLNLGIMTPNTKLIIGSELYAVMGHELAYQIGHEENAILYVLGGAMFGPSLGKFAVSGIRGTLGKWAVSGTRWYKGMPDFSADDPTTLERFFVGRDKARFYRWVTDADGNKRREMLKPWQRNTILQIIESSARHGRKDKILQDMTEVATFQKEMKELGVDSETFAMTLEEFTSLPILSALNEMNFASDQLTNFIGRLRPGSVRKLIDDNNRELDRLIAIKKLLEETFPDNLMQNAGETSQRMQAAMAAMLENRLINKLDTITALKNELTVMKKESLDIPGIYHGTDDNISTISAKLGELEVQLNKQLEDLYSSLTPDESRAFARLKEEVNDIVTIRRERSEQIGEVNPLSEFPAVHGANSNDPLDRFVSLAEAHHNRVKDHYDIEYREFFNTYGDLRFSVKNPEQNTIYEGALEANVSIMDHIYLIAKGEPTSDIMSKEFSKSVASMPVIVRIKEIFDLDAEKLIQKWRKDNTGEGRIFADDKEYEKFLTDILKDAKIPGFKRVTEKDSYLLWKIINNLVEGETNFSTKVRGNQNYKRLEDLEYSLGALHEVRRGLSDVQHSTLGRQEFTRHREYGNIGAVLSTNIRNLLDTSDQTYEIANKVRGGAEAYEILGKMYSVDYVARFRESEIGKLITGSNRKLSPIKDVSKSTYLRMNYDEKDWLNIINFKRANQSEEEAGLLYTRINKYFGETDIEKMIDAPKNIERGFVYDLKGDTTGIYKRREMRKEGDKDIEVQVDETVAVGEMVSSILNELNNRAIRDTMMLRTARATGKTKGIEATTELNTELVNMKSANIHAVFGGDEGLLNAASDELVTSVLNIIKQNEKLATSASKISSQFEIVFNNTESINQTMLRLMKRVEDQISLEGQAIGTKTIEEFADVFLSRGNVDVKRITELVDTLAGTLKESPTRVREALNNIIGHRIHQRIFSGDITNIKDTRGRPVKQLNIEEALDLFSSSKRNLILLKGGTESDANHINMVEGILEIMARQATKKNIKNVTMYSTKGLSPSSIISRIYAIDRGVVSPRYVMTEFMFIAFRRKAGRELELLLKDKELAELFFRILSTQKPLPMTEGTTQKIFRVLARTAAFARTNNELDDYLLATELEERSNNPLQ